MSVAFVGFEPRGFGPVAAFNPAGSAQLGVCASSDLLSCPTPLKKVPPRLLPGLSEEGPELRERDTLPAGCWEAVLYVSIS